jgi:hypothetical protein
MKKPSRKYGKIRETLPLEGRKVLTKRSRLKGETT